MSRLSITTIMLITIIVLATGVYAATIHGIVYDWDLEPAADVIVRVNSYPEQMLVSKDGSYSFELPEGDYLITAEQVTNNITRASVEEEVAVKGDGSYVVDLILFPSTDVELLDEPDIITEEGIEKVPAQYFNYGLLLPLLFLITLIIVIVLIIIFYKKLGANKAVVIESEDELNKVLEIIKSQGGRTTQKDIRKQIPLSEAKISLMITELEHKGLVERIKKGRENIIILKR